MQQVLPCRRGTLRWQVVRRCALSLQSRLGLRSVQFRMARWCMRQGKIAVLWQLKWSGPVFFGPALHALLADARPHKAPPGNRLHTAWNKPLNVLMWGSLVQSLPRDSGGQIWKRRSGKFGVGINDSQYGAGRRWVDGLGRAWSASLRWSSSRPSDAFRDGGARIDRWVATSCSVFSRA